MTVVDNHSLQILLVLFYMQSSVVEQTEQSQLEAAIQASLRDCQASSNVTKGSKYELVFSDSDDENDPVCLSSDAISDMDETDGGWTGIADVVDLCNDTKVPAPTGGVESQITVDSPVHLKAQTVSVGAGSEVRLKPVGIHDKSLLQSIMEEPQPELTKRNRKRTSSLSLVQDEHPRKVLRSNSTKKSGETHNVTRSSSNASNGHSVPLTSQPRKKNKKRKNVIANGVQSQTTLNFDSDTNCLSPTVEELLESGSVRKHEVSHILFRLPDGARLQKAFICSHPIEVNLIIGINTGPLAN